jgi:hypothetical protein
MDYWFGFAAPGGINTNPLIELDLSK